MTRTNQQYSTFKVVKKDGSVQWGYGIEEREQYFTVAFPLSGGRTQNISIPWHNIDSIIEEDESGAPWATG